MHCSTQLDFHQTDTIKINNLEHIVCGFHMCKSYLLKCICNPKVNLRHVFAVIHSRAEQWNIWVAQTRLIPAEAEPTALCLLVSALRLWTSILFLQSIHCHISCIFVLLLVVLLFAMAPRHSAEVPSGVPEDRKAAMGPTERRHVLDQCHSGVR